MCENRVKIDFNEVAKMVFLVFIVSFYSAYEDKKQSKRKEIASRSWFNFTSPSAGGAAGSLLHKLSLQGKEAAVAKALGSSHSPLIRRRTSEPGNKSEPCATITRTNSADGSCDEEMVKGTQKDKTLSTGSAQKGDEEEKNSSGLNKVDSKTKEEVYTEVKDAADLVKENEKGTNSGGVTSLVADYSDSDSDSTQ